MNKHNQPPADNRRARRMNLKQQLDAAHNRIQELEAELKPIGTDIATIDEATATDLFMAGVNYLRPLDVILVNISNDLAVFFGAALSTSAQAIHGTLTAAVSMLMEHLNALDLELRRLAADEVLELPEKHFEELAARCLQLRDKAARVITTPSDERVFTDYKNFVSSVNPALDELIQRSKFANRDADTIEMARHLKDLRARGIGANEAARMVAAVYNRTPDAVKKAGKRTGIVIPTRGTLSKSGDT